MPSSLPTAFPYQTLLSPAELSRIVVDPNMTGVVSAAFRYDPTGSALMRQYTFLSRNIDRLNEDLERHHSEQYMLFTYMIKNEHFQQKIAPVTRLFRRSNIRTRAHPYIRTPSPPRTPSDARSISPPSSIEIRLEDATAHITTQSMSGSLGSFQTFIDDPPLGSYSNPIIISDSDEEDESHRPSLYCGRCGLMGHQKEDCKIQGSIRTKTRKHYQ